MSPTRWRPDTCGCILLFARGPAVVPTLVTPCPVHLQATGLDIWNENRSVNDAKRVLFERHQIAPEMVRHTFGPPNGRQRDVTVEVARSVPTTVEEALATNPFGRVATTRVG